MSAPSWARRLARPARRPKPATEPAALYFLHIPKTAGTSFTTALRRQFAEHEVCPAQLWNELLAIPASHRSSYEVYIGHFYSYLGRAVDRPVQVVTFLRHPIERSLSHYAHVLREPGHYFHDRAVRQGSFAAFLEDPQTGSLITNFQVRALAQDIDVLSHASSLSSAQLDSLKLEERVETMLPDAQDELTLLSDALDALDRCAFVGLTERYEESLQRIGRLLDWQSEIPQQVLNASTERLRVDDLDASTLELLKDRVRLDQVLYEVARARFHARDRSIGQQVGV